MRTIFPEESMRKAFDGVIGGDWRDPINAIVGAEELPIVIEAIKFYTATTPRITLYDWFIEENGDFRVYRYRVESEGYRNGPAGP